MKYVVIAIGLLALCGCAPSVKRIGYGLPNAEPPAHCVIEVVRNSQELQEAKKLGTMIVYDNGLSVQCSENIIIEMIREEGCRLGAKVVNLYNIKEPSIFGSTCFQTYADFYSDGTGEEYIPYESAALQSQQERADKQAMAAQEMDTLKNNGNDIFISMDVGVVLSGGQLDLARAGVSPIPDGMSRFGGSIGYRHWGDIVGGEGALGYSVSSATKAGYKSLSMYNQVVLSAGVAVAPVRIHTPRAFHRLSLHAGLNYDWLGFESESGLPTGQTASGAGYYLRINYEFTSLSRIIWGIGLATENRNPIIAGATRALSAQEIMFPLWIGFKI